MTEFVAIPGGTFRLGSNNFYAEESPVYLTTTEPFELAIAPVTNRDFATFVSETGWITDAEKPASLLAEKNTHPAGSMVFHQTDNPVDLRDWRQWWKWVPGASWKMPRGPGSSILDIPLHPVVHVSVNDALAYCDWAGTRLPTEVEWEVAARGGLDGCDFSWGGLDHEEPNLLANTWRGRFPWRNDGALGWRGTSPIGTFPPNGYGLFDMIGNVWEWTSSRWTSSHRADSTPSSTGCGCGCAPAIDGQQFVIKGGSHLCSIDYCYRYRPSARSAQTGESSTSHIGFRVAKNQ